ncbi:metal ABC transporter ATP-binding protein [Nocardioides gilvus]|uniref:metal ABC transporter ATP-binding protein n=1 Tax=Nocardioides gilvus TaxID=1735589 RepID=UPI000D74061B|nr:ABC transporter ATP-binding protein [Nocardioides gilvus]
MLSRSSSDDDVPVRLTNVSVSIEGRPVVRGVDLQITTGEFVALMGANGSGKSTLVRAMTGLRPVARGSVRLFGTEIGHFHDWQRVGFVPQRSGAGSGVPASVWEVVSSGRLTHRRPFLPMSHKDRDLVTRAIEIVGLSGEKRAAVSNLSGGQQQRVLIARSLAGQPDLLFLDEPTAGVDMPNQQVLADTLATLSDRGVTIVLVAHELGPLAPLIDRSVVLRDGRVVHDGEPLAEAQVHHPDLGLGHAHHPPQSPALDHVPHVAGPFETPDPDEEVR